MIRKPFLLVSTPRRWIAPWLSILAMFHGPLFLSLCTSDVPTRSFTLRLIIFFCVDYLVLSMYSLILSFSEYYRAPWHCSVRVDLTASRGSKVGDGIGGNGREGLRGAVCVYIANVNELSKSRHHSAFLFFPPVIVLGENATLRSNQLYYGPGLKYTSDAYSM
jgi:hypothetical protein